MNYNEFLKNFGLQLKMIRMKKGISQADLAEMLGVHENYISDIERGKRNITLKTIHKITNALGVNGLKLFDFE